MSLMALQVQLRQVRLQSAGIFQYFETPAAARNGDTLGGNGG